MRRFECGAIVFDLDGVLVDARAVGESSGGADRLLASLPLGSWGVATTSRRTAAGDRLRRAGLPVPPVLVCAGDVLRGKPSPDAYLRAARELDVEPLQCLVVADSPAGIEAARTAGMPVIALTTNHPPDQLRADACTRDLAAVHLGRIDRGLPGHRLLEILVVEA
jgi:sugar-phosphatase